MKRGLSLLLCAGLVAACVTKVDPGSLRFDAGAGVTLPSDGRLTIAVDQRQLNRTLRPGRAMTSIKDGRVMLSAATTVFGRLFSAVSTNDTGIKPHLIARVTGRGEVETFWGTYTAWVEVDLHYGSGDFFKRFEGTATAASMTIVDNTAMENAYVNAFKTVSDAILEDPVMAPYFAAGFDPAMAAVAAQLSELLASPAGQEGAETGPALRWVDVQARRQKRREMAARMERQATPVNARYRVVSGRAAIRDMPDADARELKSIPQGAEVFVSASLPNGWLRVAEEGRPFGWVFATALRRVAEATPPRVPSAGAKPSVFVAYPKGGEELAEPTVRLFGYVTTENRTKRMTAYVNGLPLDVGALWRNANPIAVAGLRGYPVDFAVPLQMGANEIGLQVLDEQGFLVRHTITVERIGLDDGSAPVAAAAQAAPAPLPDAQAHAPDQAVTAENFMTVLADWLKTAALEDYNKGNRMFRDGRYVRAAYYYGKSIKAEPSGRAHFNRAVTRLTLGREPDARADFDDACRLDQPSVCVWLKRTGS